jgi:hypothetical protein
LWGLTRRRGERGGYGGSRGDAESAPAEALPGVPITDTLNEFAPDRPLTVGYPPGAANPGETANHRNGASGKTVVTDDGPVDIGRAP